MVAWHAGGKHHGRPVDGRLRAPRWADRVQAPAARHARRAGQLRAEPGTHVRRLRDAAAPPQLRPDPLRRLRDDELRAAEGPGQRVGRLLPRGHLLRAATHGGRIAGPAPPVRGAERPGLHALRGATSGPRRAGGARELRGRRLPRTRGRHAGRLRGGVGAGARASDRVPAAPLRGADPHVAGALRVDVVAGRAGGGREAARRLLRAPGRDPLPASPARRRPRAARAAGRSPAGRAHGRGALRRRGDHPPRRRPPGCGMPIFTA